MLAGQNGWSEQLPTLRGKRLQGIENKVPIVSGKVVARGGLEPPTP